MASGNSSSMKGNEAESGARPSARLLVGVLTISDRGARGEYEDLSGPAIQKLVTAELGAEIACSGIVPDERALIREKLIEWADGLHLDLILTTGGTGFSPRDITPEATLDIIERETPGLVEAMRAASLQLTPHAMLSRARAGIRGRTLIINLPGSPRGAVENLKVALPAIPHGIELLQEAKGSNQRHDYSAVR